MSYVRIQGDVFTPVSVRQIVKVIQRETGKTLPDLANVPEARRNERLAEYGVFPYTTDPQPTFDPETQRLRPGDFREEGGAYFRGWAVEDIPQAELDEAKDQEVMGAIDQLAFKILFRHENQIRAATGRPELSRAQFAQFLRANL
jgi:hypothetical protein